MRFAVRQRVRELVMRVEQVEKRRGRHLPVNERSGVGTRLTE
jgi:hypothetical protein